VAAAQVVGWFQGRMEWGPRALGNRSIVCDPRRADMKDILNLKIKRRESSAKRGDYSSHRLQSASSACKLRETY